MPFGYGCCSCGGPVGINGMGGAERSRFAGGPAAAAVREVMDRG
jgi:hypothetical protein